MVAACESDIYAPLISRTEAASMYFVNAVDLYCERLAMRSPRSDYPVQVRRVLDRLIARRDLTSATLDEVTSLQIDHYFQSRATDLYRGKPIVARTVNNEIDILNQFFRYFGPKELVGAGRKNLGLLKLEQVPYYEPMDEDELDPVVLEDSTIEKFLRNTIFAPSPRATVCDPVKFWHAVILLEGITLLRRRSLLEILRPDDETLLERRILILPAKSNKTKRREIVSLGTNLAAIGVIASLPSLPGEPLLPWKHPNGTPLSANHFSQTVRRIQQRAGIPAGERLRIKDLRSTGATITGEEYGELAAKAKLKHSPNTNTFRCNYQGRRISGTEIKATDDLSTRMLSVMHRASQPDLRVTG